MSTAQETPLPVKRRTKSRGLSLAGVPSNHTDSGAVTNSPQVIGRTISSVCSPVEPNVLDGQFTNGTHEPSSVEAQSSPPGQRTTDPHRMLAGRGPILHDPFLDILGKTVDDMERTRIAVSNRLFQLTNDKPDKDGVLRGLCMDVSSPEVKIVSDLFEAMKSVEHQAVLKLNRQMRKQKLWTTWAVNQKGIGEKTFARLLGAIGDPYWNDLHNAPRKVSQLWAYCGMHTINGQAPKRARGQKINWSQDARKRIWLISTSCLKAQGYYADVYYEAREKYAEAIHEHECVRCGPQGKPALMGSPLSDAHKLNRGLRAVSKEILRDLWIAARDLHLDT